MAIILRRRAIILALVAMLYFTRRRAALLSDGATQFAASVYIGERDFITTMRAQTQAAILISSEA